MRVIRGEPVEVWLRDGRPARFVWRGRMSAAEPASDPAKLPLHRADPAPGGRECWRVEATPERTVPPTTYELCRDLASGRWSLSRGRAGR